MIIRAHSVVKMGKVQELIGVCQDVELEKEAGHEVFPGAVPDARRPRERSGASRKIAWGTVEVQGRQW